MRRLLLLLAWEGSLAAGRDAGGVVPALTKQDSAVPPWVRAHRDLQSSSCDYAVVSGSSARAAQHGTYELNGECESQPYFSCLDCGSTQYIWYTSKILVHW